MKKTLYIILTVILVSCGRNNLKFDDRASLETLKKELNSKFGDNAFYTNLSIVNSDIGGIVSVSQTDTPSSLKMSDWSYVQGKWQQKTEITLEVSGNAKAEDFMFQLHKTLDFNTLINVVEASKKRVIEEKKIKKIKVELISISAPDNGDFKSMKYYITIKPKQGGTQFSFWYNMDGSLDKFDY